MSIRLINGEGLLEKQVTNVARLRPVLTANADPYASNATLRKDEWERVDEQVNGVFRERLTVADDLRGRGLVSPLSLGTIIRVTERLEDFDEAELSFDGDSAPQADRTSYRQDARSVPVVSKDFRINWRQLESSRERGDPLDLTSAETAARKVRDKIQDLITNGMPTGGPTGGGIPGLRTAANRLTVDLDNAWNASGGDPRGDTIAMLETAYDSNLFGPFIMYLPKNYWAEVQDDYTTGSGDPTNRTHMERLLAFEDIEQIRPLDALPDDEVLLVQMTRDVLDLSEAQAVTTVQWEKNPFVTNFRVLFVGGPHIKSIETDKGTTINGIVHLRTA